MEPRNETTRNKASQINLDPTKYGTFAEIGAGQEVARWFFQVGGASGTVAKSMSAYDMVVSDAVYGPTDRYVSRRRLEAMLDHEYTLLLERLDAKRGDKTKFFVFADTVAARSYTRREEGHGWMGIRFQTEPRGKPSEIMIHVRMLEKENLREQEALGVVGVNLIYGAFYQHDRPEMLIGALMDDLTQERISVDMIRFCGPAFEKVDNRLMSLRLVAQGLTDSAMFRVDGEVAQPGDLLHKRPILVQRGSFRPLTNPVADMLASAQAQFIQDTRLAGEDIVVLLEMTLRNLLSEKGIDHEDFLARVEILGSLGKTVLISSYARYHRVAAYLCRYTDQPIGVVLGAPSLKEIFKEEYYKDLEGEILEGLGKLCRPNVTLYIYPSLDRTTGELVTAENIEVQPHLRHLYRHFLEDGRIRSIRAFKQEGLHIFPADVLARIERGDPSWETMVPPEVRDVIKSRGYLGYREPERIEAGRAGEAK